MKTPVVLTALVLGIVLSGSGQLAIPKENQVILRDSKDWPEIKWIPSEEQTEKALTAIEQLLNNPTSFGELPTKNSAQIREHFAEYRVQFFGVTQGGKKYIHCNFFRAETGESRWKNRYISVDDGGFWFWNILYNPVTGKLSNLSINGEA